MAQWTHKQYDLLERAITNGKRISAFRRGTEYVVVPMRLRVISGREAVEATQEDVLEDIVIGIPSGDSDADDEEGDEPGELA